MYLNESFFEHHMKIINGKYMYMLLINTFSTLYLKEIDNIIIIDKYPHLIMEIQNNSKLIHIAIV